MKQKFDLFRRCRVVRPPQQAVALVDGHERGNKRKEDVHEENQFTQGERPAGKRGCSCRKIHFLPAKAG